jgi:hypothetical protein
VRLTLAIGLSIIFIAAGVAYSRLPGSRQAGVFAIDPPTPYFRYSNGNSRGRVLVVHGLDVNKHAMNILSYGLADAGFEVFSIDLPGHGASSEPFNAVHAGEVAGRVLGKLGADTSVVAHSLGGALLVDFARDHPVGNMVLLSPAPTPVDTIQVRRLLVIVGQFDLPPFRAFAAHVAAADGGADLKVLAWAGHAGALVKPAVIRFVADWLGGDSARIQTAKRFSLLMLMFASGIVLGIVLLGSSTQTAPPSPPLFPAKTVILAYIGAAAVAVAVLAFVNVAAWLRLFSTDYLVGFLFLAGSVLCLGGVRIRVAAGPLLIATAAAAYVIVVPGLLVASEFIQMTLPAARWWRFPAILLMGLPLCIADEFLIRPILSRWRGALLFLLTRLLFGAIVVAATLIWNRGSAFLLLIVYIVVFFWLTLWVAGDFVRRRTGDPLAAAVFISILQAWLFAALFVIT